MADDLSDPPSLYDTDFLAWTEEQEAALLSRARGNVIDWNNLAEEIGDLGRSEFRGCESDVQNVIEHLMKIEVIGSADDLRGWRKEVRNWRNQLRKRLTPSMRNRLIALLTELHASAAREVKEDYELGAAPGVFYSWDQILDHDWWPKPAPASGK